jgi:hypothetical protein
MEYQEKLKIANEYLNNILGVDWEDLPDINSLHDADSKEDIIELCKERIADITEIEPEDLDFIEEDDEDDNE